MRLSRLFAAATALVAATTANAQLVTAPTANMTNSVDQSGAACSNSFTAGPVALPPAVVYTSSNGSSVVCYHAGYGLSSNGLWNNVPEGYAGLNAPGGWIRFTFSAPVAAAGGFVNWAPGFSNSGDVFIRALDGGNNVIQSFSFADVLTPGQTNGGAFRGISHNVADIATLEFADGYVVAKDVVFSDPGVSVNSTPEPATLVLVGSGFVGLVGVVRRRKTAA